MKDVDRDVYMLNQYRNFRDEAEKIGMRHFLEVFNSAVIDLSIEQMGEYVNDCILKTLAGQISKEKPLFLKIALTFELAPNADSFADNLITFFLFKSTDLPGL